MTNIKYIYHLSDIHIRNDERHLEYGEVFDTTLNTLKIDIGDNKNNSLIVMTGDIMHDCNSITIGAQKLLTNFLEGLSKLANTYLLPGNHDCNVHNPNKVDILSQNINKNFVNYLKDSGSYVHGNITFGVTSVYDKQIYKLDNNVKTRYKIALAHLPNNSRLYHAFTNYDYVLLGDAHNFQYVNNNKKIAYAGSLIKQNHRETEIHGVLKWYLETGKSELIPIDNNYGYHIVYAKNGLIKSDLKLKPKPNIILNITDTTLEDQNKIIKKLKKEYDVQAIEVNDIINNKQFTIKIDRENMYNYETQLEYIKICETTHMGKNNILSEKIEKLHLQLYNELRVIPKWTHGFIWEITRLEFSNTLCYGPNNVINFTKYKKNSIIHIDGPNGSGKSSIVDIILRCLYNSTSRCTINDIISVDDPNMSSTLCFKIDNKKYEITKTNGIKKTIKFNSTENDIKINLGMNSTDTDIDKKIINKIGSIGQCLITSVYSHWYDKFNFIGMGPTDKKEYLQTIFGINIFTPYYEHIKKNTLLSDLNISKKQFSNLQEPDKNSQNFYNFVKENIPKYHTNTLDHNNGIDIFNLLNKIDPNTDDEILLLEQKIETFYIINNEYIQILFKLLILYQNQPCKKNSYQKLIMYRLNLFKENENILRYNFYLRELFDAEKNIVDEQNQLHKYIESKKELKTKINRLEEDVKTYSIYTKMMHIDGIPFTLLENYLPEIETRVNNHLIICGQQFKIIFKRDSKNNDIIEKKIDIHILRPSKKSVNIINSCEYQIFFVNIIFKIVLRELSLIPKSNFLIIDERWDCFDKGNKKYIKILLEHTKKYYDYVIIMSHLDHFVDNSIIDYVLEIKTKNEFSYINNDK